MSKLYTFFALTVLSVLLLTVQTKLTAQTGYGSVTNLNALTISASTGFKPQAKVWEYDGSHFAVLPNTSGTFLWKLNKTTKTWSSILKLSSNTTSHADYRLIGNVAHIFLYQGTSSQLVSAEYVTATATYKLWKKRNTTVSLTLDSGVETGSIDIDGTGRMWLASAGVADINVRWSDPPYKIWSAPIAIATGVKDDDISAAVYMPTAGKIGVLWSNQNTKRFGFKTHTDGSSPSLWSNDEIPASQSALNVGGGMADDHINMTISKDGTLYCAVKTSYDLAGYPKMALLIRRPAGTWDNLYEVSQTGSRPIVLLNEAKSKLRYVYTSGENGGDIIYKETSTSGISFSSSMTLIAGGIYTNSTSTHQNLNSEVVILASDTNSTKAAGVLASDAVTSPLPNVPSLVSPANATTTTTSSPTLSWSAATNATSYDVQVSTVSNFSTIVFDLDTIATNSGSIPGLSNGTVYYWRAKAINEVGSSNWSTIWSFTTAAAPAGQLIANLKMDEGSGTTLTDSSSFANNATTTGNPTWVTGVNGQALKLNGTSQYATVPDNVSLDITAAITLAAWIKPEKLATQYIIKKAISGSTNGYELSLSSGGQVFFRFNQASSADTYKLSSVASYPRNGTTWMHVAATYDGSVIKLYINGIENTSKTLTSGPPISANALVLSIGAQSDGTSKFQGAVDNVQIYSKALSASEISALAAAPNQAPVLAAIGNKTAAVGQALTFTATATDPDAGQTKTFSLTGAPNGAAINATSGAFTWMPVAAGSYTFTVRVTDNGSPILYDEETITVTVTASNQAPVLAAIGNKTATVGQALTFTATATDPDAGQTKTFSLTGAPTSAAINATSGAFTWTPAAAGSYTFTVRVTDNGSPVLYDEETITVTVSEATLTNNAPVLTAIGNKTATVGQVLTFTATATDPDTDQTQTFSLTGAPSGAAIDASSGVFTWTPSTTGSFTFTIRVTDNGSPALFDEETITVTVAASNGPLIANWKMDEGSGTTLIDASGFGNNASTTGSPMWVTGVAGQALKLNGTSQFATVPDNASLDITGAITLSAWIKPEKFATQYIIKKAIGGSTNGYELSLSSSGIVFFRFNQATSGDSYRLNSVTAHPNNGATWMHIAATYDGSSLIKIYINGVENSSKTITTPASIITNSLALAVGAQSDGVGKFQGTIDDVRVYNAALNASEINALAATSPTTLAKPSSIVSTSPGLQCKLNIYPNPSSYKATITFTLLDNEDYAMILYDIKGTQINVVKRGKALAGKLNTVDLNCSSLTNGIYTVGLSTNSKLKTLKLIVNK